MPLTLVPNDKAPFFFVSVVQNTFDYILLLCGVRDPPGEEHSQIPTYPAYPLKRYHGHLQSLLIPNTGDTTSSL